jgi:GTP-binding protein
MVRMIFHIPTRGLIGYRSQFLTDTRGTGMMNYIFNGYAPAVGEFRNRKNGAMVTMEDCTSTSYALFNLQERGRLFISPGEKLYRGQIIGENNRENDLVVNPGKGKKLSNMRTTAADEAIILTPPAKMSLEDFISFVNDDEIVEITPLSIRVRKM